MIFDMFCINKILKGEKTVTRRLMRNDKWPAKPGHIHKLKKDRTKKTYGNIKIIDCKPEILSFNMKKIEAIREGFDSVEDYIKYFNKVNNTNITPNNGQFVWRVEFEVL